MTADPIREALEAAARAGCACDCKAPQPGCMQTVADEVAAFLRAYSATIPTALIYGPAIADAVERATQTEP